MSDDATSMILSAIRTLQAGLDELRTGQHELRAEMTEMRTEVRGEMTGLRVGLMDRMDRLENSLTLIRDDIGVTMGRADRVQESNDGTREELRLLGKIVSGMGRQIHNLQVRMDRLGGVA